ncbi:MAG: AAA family ATPase [Pseudomonadota bacterium]
MMITRFKVSGYKNLVRPVELRRMESVVVIHGPNNVGKSNLIEAMGLPFMLLGLGGASRSLPLERELTLDPQELTDRGYAPADIFNLDRPRPIEIEFELAAAPEVFSAEEMPELGDVRSVSIALSIHPGPPEITWRLSHFTFTDDHDAAQTVSPDLLLHAKHIGLLIAQNYLVGGGGGERRFQIVGTPSRKDPRQHVPSELGLALFDAQEATQRQVYQRWELFADRLSRFSDVLGSSTVRTVYDRKSGTAELVVQYASHRTPVRLLGMGIQQLIVLLGSLVTSGAQVVAVEEPEANLSFGLQLRLREALRDLVADPRGPSQLIFTSHSPGFQVGSDFYALIPAAGGPRLTRLAASDAPTVTGLTQVHEPDAGDSAPISWVTSDGLLRLPPSVLADLGIVGGGGVGFLPADNGVRLVSNAQALTELGWEGEE